MNTQTATSATQKVFLFLGVALLLRLFWAQAVPVDPVSDSLAYRLFAESIASGKGYAYTSGELTVFWPVGASAIYAAVMKVFGYSHWAAVGVNIVAGMGVVILTYSLTSRYLNREVGIASGWLVACWPVLVQFTTVYASELIFTCLLLSALYVWGSPGLNKTWKACLWGVLLCAATYVRPTSLPLFFLLPLIEYLENRNWKNAVYSLIVAVVTAAVLFAPWVQRNQKVFGHPVLVSANFGSNFWMGNNPKSQGTYMPLPDMKFENEVQRDQRLKELALEYITAHPQEYVRLAWKRFISTYDRETIGVAWNEAAISRLMGEGGRRAIKFGSTAYWWLIASIGFVGLGWAFWTRRVGVFAPLVVVPAFFFVIPILTVGQDRYHLPLNPFFAVFAAFAFVSFVQAVKNRKG
jgi:4-amino-4-deoxy-L-arabinose transferase-like glycosyltransferase